VRTLWVMAVHLTRIYTRTGDAGTTRLGNNEQVAKTDPRIAAYADTDECNAAIGVALALGQLDDDVRAVLTAVQNDLFDVGADLCNPVTPDPAYPPLRVTEEYVTRLEGWCDEFNARLSKLDSFVLPGGTPGAALLHVARTIARRAERAAWALVDSDPQRTGPLPAKYLNRLSDLLFILARAANPQGDVLWVPGGQR
jgi:cob(I)alamin adenosyltransferase